MHFFLWGESPRRTTAYCTIAKQFTSLASCRGCRQSYLKSSRAAQRPPPHDRSCASRMPTTPTTLMQTANSIDSAATDKERCETFWLAGSSIYLSALKNILRVRLAYDVANVSGCCKSAGYITWNNIPDDDLFPRLACSRCKSTCVHLLTYL